MNDLPKDDFDQEKLDKVWKEFYQSISKEMPRLFQVFKVYKPTLKENLILELKVGSELQKNDIKERAYNKMDGFIKKHLNNYSVRFSISVLSGKQKNNVVYTTTDKYNYLAEQNENLHKLKQSFSLDFD